MRAAALAYSLLFEPTVNVLVLAALTDATGNAVTARRIASHLAIEHRVTLADAVTATAASLRELVREERIDLAIGVHALLAGPFLRAIGIPYALVFGGTDLYEQTHELQRNQMARAVQGAARLIAFSPENIARAEWMWPSVCGRVELVPQAIEAPLPDEPFSLRAMLGLRAGDLLLVLPTGIRRVKDPLHVVDAISAWHEADPSVHLAVAGALLEPDYAEGALRILRERPGVHYVSALSRERMLAAIHEADVVLNTSLSEGMCGVLLEAMCLGTPVVARRNAGNESLVQHGHTGLLYDAPHEVVHWARALVASTGLRERIAATARRRIEAVHAPAIERDAYLRIVDELGPDARPSLLPSAAVADELDVVLPAGERVGLDAPILDALRAMLARIRESAELAHLRRELAGLLGTAPPSVAIDAIRRADLEALLGRDDARTFYLLLALLQVPTAEARAAARGVEPEIVRATLGELAMWARHFAKHTGARGITLEILEWAQRYLRGELFMIGPLQFDLRPFAQPMRVYRHRTSRALSAVTLDGRAIDLESGTVVPRDRPLHDDAWEVALEPGSPILEMWIPGALSFVTLREVARSMREAYALFAKLAPETVPVGACGESWRLDPQILAFVPSAPGVQDLQRACCLFPAGPSEEQTIRRLFGPDATRADIALNTRENMDPVQRAIASFLADPKNELRARGGFVLREELEATPEWS